MSTTPNGEDGGPAFPMPVEGRDFANGMSLRDYFAAAALQGFLAMKAHPQAIGNPSAEVASTLAYRYADAMISQRGK